MGLDAIAITDHDTMAGVRPAAEAGKKADLRVIPGAEITTRDYGTGRPVHLLCYYPARRTFSESFWMSP